MSRKPQNLKEVNYMKKFFSVFGILALGFFTLLCGQEAFAAQPVRGTLDVSGANKWHAISSSLTHVSPGVRVPLFGPQPLEIRTSETGDLVIEVHAECAVVMDDFDPSFDFDAAFMRVRVWVEIDGVPVEVGSRPKQRKGQLLYLGS
jgi:hypothetical protein